MTSDLALPRLRSLPCGGRAAERIVRSADARNLGRWPRMVRAVAKLPSRPIPVYWWTAMPNFGDALSKFIVARISNGTPVRVSPTYRRKVLAAGSVLHRLAPGDWVWGTGAIQDATLPIPPGVRICAVRGPLTHALLPEDSPRVFGDPVMLLPRYYSPTPRKHFDVGLIPHLSDQSQVIVRDPCVSVIDVRANWQSVVDKISECDLVLSSSLHGLVVAEAYGIPALWVSLGDNVKGHGFKFWDYYLSTQREPPNCVPFAEAMHNPDRYRVEPAKIDLEPLVRAWPKELAFPAPVS